MNKRIAKKWYKKALDVTKTSRKTGIGVNITNHAYVDVNGKVCNPIDIPMSAGGRFVTLKRPRIQYFRKSHV